MHRQEDLQAHIRSLHRFATGLTGNPVDAEDLVQECLRRVLAHLKGNNTVTNLRAYLFRTLRNVHIDQCRKQKSRGYEVDADADSVEYLSVAPSQEDRLRCADISSALDTLPESQREVILLSCLEGMTYEDVAEVTGNPIGTVRSRLHRGRAALRELLDPAHYDSQPARGAEPLSMVRKA